MGRKLTAEPTPTIINYRRGQETRFLKETGFLMGRKLTAEPTPTIINY